MLSNKDTKTLIILRNVIASSENLDLREKQALDIKQVMAKPYLIGLQSAEAYISRVLYKADKPLHFSEIMDGIEKLGWKTDSRYHKYGYIARVLHEGYYMFKRVAPATYALRKAFSKRFPKKDVLQTKKWSNVPIPSTKEIMNTIIANYKPTSVNELYQMLKFVGYDFSLSYVKEIAGKELALRTK